jgi:sugar/nucleoside kinase (ribokinase family)
MPQDFDVIVAGHICLDIIPALSHEKFTFAPGRLLEVGPAVISTGGPVSNTGLALHKLGIPTRLMGKISDDSFGGIIRGVIAAYDPRLVDGMIEAVGEASSYSVILSPPDADRMFLHCPGCNDTFGCDDIDYAMVGRARLFHFGYPPLLKRVIVNGGGELVEIFRRAKETGVTTSLDLAMPDPMSSSAQVKWAPLLESTLPYVDIFLPSFEETLFMLYPRDFDEATRSPSGVVPDPALVTAIGSRLIGMGPSIAGLKLGTAGLYLKTADGHDWKGFGRAHPPNLDAWRDRELWSPCFETRVAGTTGAGDATIAGFIAGLLRGGTPEACATMACAVGACNVEATDALGGLKTWEQTEKRLNSGWQRKPLPLPAGEWRPAGSTGVWERLARQSKGGLHNLQHPNS